MQIRHFLALLGTSLFLSNVLDSLQAAEPSPARTTLSNPDLKFTVPETGYTVLKRGPIEAVIVDNRAVDDAVLPGHKAGYHGVGALRHERQPRNLFVPSVSGLNFEHIHDGTVQPRNLLFEPRNVAMELRRINDFTAELYQPPTPHWGLESCMRYELLDSGAIEMTFECIPRRDTYKNGYIGLFWASYIDQPESLDIHFRGRAKAAANDTPATWIRGVTPKHGELATHLAATDHRAFPHAADFPLTLVFGESNSRYAEPWYVGRCRDMAFAQTFRVRDQVRLSQSPSGGGNGNPAWDFQWFIPAYKIGERYQLVMRAAYFPVAELTEAAVLERASLVTRAAQIGLGNPIPPTPPPAQVTNTIAKLKRSEPTKIVCLGDSVTGVYYHTGGQRAYTDMLGIALQKAVPNAKLTMVNAGISGHSTVNALERLERDVLKHEPDLVTVMFGLNDMTRVPIEQYRANLVTIIHRCWASGAEVLLCTPNNVIDTSGRPSAKLVTYCDVIREVGKSLGVPVADCYAGMEALRTADPFAWRLLLSDEIHPNMDGHKRMAEILARAISGEAVSLQDVKPPAPSLARIAESVKAGRAVKILAMPPFDVEIKPLLERRLPNASLEIVTWKVADQTLPQIERDAQARVRALRPDLVIIAVPRSASAPSKEAFVHSYSWVMNWSLSFGRKEWECVVVHPSVADAEHNDPEFDELVRKLVRAQDLELVDRKAGDKQSAAELLNAAIKDL